MERMCNNLPRFSWLKNPIVGQMVPKSSILGLQYRHRRIVGASDLNGYARNVLTEGNAGGNLAVVVVVERSAWF